MGFGLAWAYAVLLALLPWVFVYWPWWAPAAAAVAVLLRWINPRRRAAEPGASALVVIASLIHLAVLGGVLIAAGWAAAAALVAGATIFGTRYRSLGRPDAGDLVALVIWAVAIGLERNLIENGGWLAPILVLFGIAQVIRSVRRIRRASRSVIGPPSRAVRGTLSLRALVLGEKGLRRSVPLDLTVRAGDSIAILCDNAVAAEEFAMTVAGRRPALEGEITIDTMPLEMNDRLVAVVAPGEEFLAGDLALNVGALCDEEPEHETLVAVHDGCGLAEIVDSLEGGDLNTRGKPLSRIHRLMVLAARVVPSEYRLVVVVDPSTWIGTVENELWRRAVVRASVGRTALWFTSDRDLAQRASQVLEFRHGALRGSGGFSNRKEQE